MLREEAKRNLVYAKRWNDRPTMETLDYVIRVLEQQPCEDAINRAEAINRIEVRRNTTCESDPYSYEEWTKGYEEGIDDAIAMINSIPSVTPSYNSIKTELKPFDDWISREAAINTVVFECGEWAGLAKEISKQLQQLPSVAPQPKIGKWIRSWCEWQQYLECSKCGYETGLKCDTNYCPNCGAKMEVEE